MNRREILRYATASAGAFAMAPGALAAERTQVGPSGSAGQEGSSAKAATGAYSVKDFGAAGNGSTLDTQAINRTIEACSAAGGGMVLFPAGVYLTGTVHLKSNITLCLDAGATILGSKNLNDYADVMAPQQTQVHIPQWHAALIEGHGLSNIAITGRGTVDGNKVFNPNGEEHMRGPHAIFLNKCDGILVQDILVKDASNYAHLMQDCTNGNLRGVTVKGGWDGIDLFDCQDFIITGCHFMTGDDCVAGGGWERVVVSNCTLNTSCNGVRNYRRGLENVLFTNLVIAGPGTYEHRTSRRHDLLAAFNLYGGGILDNVVISNVSVSKTRCVLWMANQKPGGAIRNVSINNLTATAVGMPGDVASLIQGIEDNPVESVSLSNVTIVSLGGGAKDLVGRPVPAHIGDPYVSLPCYGLFCRYVNDLELHDVRFSYSESDARPALICESIGRLELDSVRGQPGTESGTPIVLRDIKTLVRSPEADGG